ncbi:MAG: hypothetical protein JNL08_11400 [Planctomycetes bacterium]|nr:hypothetical protein [Planctomycetota bacterium]
MTKNLADDLQRTARQALSSLSPVAQGEEPGGLPFRRLLAAMFRARYLVFATTLFGLLIGSFLAITTPNTYSSVGKFQFTASGAEAQLVDPSRATALTQETIGNTAPHILNTDDLLLRVIQKLGADRILAPYQPGTGVETGARAWFYQVQRDWNATTREATDEEALKMLRRSLMIETPRGQPVLVATYTANSPELAQEVLKTYMTEAVLWHIELYDDKRAYDEAQQVFEDSKITLETARRALRTFLDEKAQVPDFVIEKASLEKAASDAAENQAEMRQKLEGARRVLAEIHQRLEVDKSVKPTRTEQRRQMVGSLVQQQLETKYGDELIALLNLEALYRQKDHPDIVRKTKELETIRAAILRAQEDTRNAPFEQVEVDNPEYLQYLTVRQRVTVEMVEFEAQLKLVDQVAGDARAKLKTLLDLEPEYSRLSENLDKAAEHAGFARTKWEAAQSKRALGQGNFSSLKPIQQASMPLEKEGPNRSKLLLGGLFAGLFAGLAIVILRALPDNVVRTRDDLERIEGLAVIGVMPRLDGSNLRRHMWLREQGW